jgi:DNA-directed RNA polymerase subunit N (RpoN/RPB10)
MTRAAARFWWKEDLPKHIIYVYRDDIDDDWKEYTRAEHNAKKKKKQDSHISIKRYCHRRVPCFIYVFKINNDFLFSGWFIAVWSVYGMWYLNWRTFFKHENFFPSIKQHLNLGLLPIVDNAVWFEEFCKAYPMKPKGIQHPRGKYLTHCIIDSYNNLIDIDLGQKT